MAFQRRWLLILLALVLSGGSLLADSREDRAYAAAVLAFQDKFYPLAEAKLTQFLQTYRKSTNAPAALLLLAQSEFYLKDYAAVTNRLADPVNLAGARAAGLADRYDYWRAEAQFAAGNPGEAAGTFVSVATNYPDSRLALKAVVEAAAAFGKNGNWARVDDLLESTNGLFQRRARLDPASEPVAAGRLLQAESRCAQQDFAGAIRVLGLVNTLIPGQDWKRALLLYRADLGGRNLEEALVAATNLVQIARLGQGDAWTTNLAESVACLAEAFEAAGRTNEAARAWQQNLGTNTPAVYQRRAILKVADLAVAQGNLRDAEASLTDFLAHYPDSPAGGVARLRLGELQLQEFVSQPTATNQLALARTNLDAIIQADPNGPLRPLMGKAHLDRGWCDWLEAMTPDTNASAVKLAESLANFQAATNQLPPGSEDLAVAYFKTGDAQFALAKYGDATNSYQAVLTGFSGLTNVAHSLGGRALYQILRAQLKLNDTNGMDDSMRQLLRYFADSEQAANGLLLAGQGFSDFGDSAKARALFEQFARERTNSWLMPQVLFALARTYETEQNWPATVTNCEAWLRSYPTNQSLPDVEYVRNWAVSQTGDEARAFELFTNFVTRYSTNAQLAPLARWWVADHYFRLGTSFLDAEMQYELIFQDFPNDPLAGEAQLMAARAAMARSSYPQAILYVTPLISNTNAPESLRDKARFAYCEAKRGMTSETNTLSLLDATNVLAQMYHETPTNLAGALAWCETGACDLQLGAFDAATNAFAQVLAAPSATTELRCRAQAGLGDVWQKKADGLPREAQRPLLSQALANYMQVIYTSQDYSDPYWMKYAALKALPLMPLVQEGDVQAFITRLEQWLPQLKDMLEKKRAAVPTQ